MKTLIERLMAYWFAAWHLRQAPLRDVSKSERAAWIRDHSGQFAARWFAVGAGLWLLFMTPFVSFWPIAVVGLFGLVMGMWHISWQIVAQKQAGPPPIEPPVEFRDVKPSSKDHDADAH